MSAPAAPSILSLPAKPLMVSLPAVPTRLSSPDVPLIVVGGGSATSSLVMVPTP
jgi:hypothetical protein